DAGSGAGGATDAAREASAAAPDASGAGGATDAARDTSAGALDAETKPDTVPDTAPDTLPVTLPTKSGSGCRCQAAPPASPGGLALISTFTLALGWSRRRRRRR